MDGFDVRSGMNPCSGIKPGKIYVGSEPDELGRRFEPGDYAWKIRVFRLPESAADWMIFECIFIKLCWSFFRLSGSGSSWVKVEVGTTDV